MERTRLAGIVRRTARVLDFEVTPPSARPEATQMAKGQNKQRLSKTNKPKVTTKAKQAKKAERKAATTPFHAPTVTGESPR